MILDLGDRNVWERAFYIRAYFYNLQGSAIFSNTYSPQARALSFVISTQSPIPANGEEDPSYDRLKQRYVLAVIYYSLNGENWPLANSNSHSPSELWVSIRELITTINNTSNRYPSTNMWYLSSLLIILLDDRKAESSISPINGHLSNITNKYMM